MTDWLTRSAASLGREIEKGAIDTVELTDAFLEAISAHPEAGRIYARTMPEAAHAAAEAARRRAKAGERLGPLDGVPISWKDLFDTEGVVTEAGSKLLAGRLPEEDAVVVQRGAAAGLVPLGKTHLSELAFSGLGLNPMTATSPNPHGGGLCPGGSSSGAAASVSFGLAAAGIGSDTGGSVRLPAAWHDLVGLKTTHGLIPLDGVVPLIPSLDTVGPLCRTVEDAALIHAVLDGSDPADLSDGDLSTARFLVETGVFQDGVDPSIARGFETALERLARAGAGIEERALPAVGEVLEHSWIVGVESYAVWGDEIEANPDAMFPMIRARFETGKGKDAVAYQRALMALAQLRKDWIVETLAFDAVLAPTVAIAAPEAAPLLADERAYVETNLKALRNTRIGNMLGLSALTVPTGTPMAGLMLMGRPFGEARLLALGAAAERALV